MQVVSTVVCGKQLRAMAWVPQNRIEIDHAIEFTTAENPRVNLLTYRFPLGSIKSRHQSLESRVFKWRVCGPNDSNMLLVTTGDELTIAGNNVLGAYTLAWRSKRKRRKKNVIDT